MSPPRSWKPCADKMPCSPLARAANSPPPPSSALWCSRRRPAAGTSLSWINRGPLNLDLTKSTWKTSASWRARRPQASCTRSSVTGISGSAGSASRRSRRGSCYRCTCARRTPTGNPDSSARYVCLVKPLLAFLTGANHLLQPPPWGNPVIRGVCVLAGQRRVRPPLALVV